MQPRTFADRVDTIGEDCHWAAECAPNPLWKQSWRRLPPAIRRQ